MLQDFIQLDLLPLRQSFIKMIAKQAVKVEKTINKGCLFTVTPVDATPSETPFSVIERNEFNPNQLEKYGHIQKVL